MVSKQPRKQRKRLYRAPLHRRHKFVGAHLSKELRKKYGRRSIPIRKGDKVRIMRGQFRGLIGTVTRVDLKKLRVYVDVAKIKRVSGEEVHYPIHPSNLEIIELNLDDPRRRAVLERSGWREEEEVKKG